MLWPFHACLCAIHYSHIHNTASDRTIYIQKTLYGGMARNVYTKHTPQFKNNKHKSVIVVTNGHVWNYVADTIRTVRLVNNRRCCGVESTYTCQSFFLCRAHALYQMLIAFFWLCPSCAGVSECVRIIHIGQVFVVPPVDAVCMLPHTGTIT